MTDGATKLMMANKAHKKFGHTVKTAMRKAAKAQGVEIVWGTIKACEAYILGKAKQNNVPKMSDHKPATSDAQQIVLDIVTFRQNKNGPNVTKPN
jgi:hypothetical protein